MSESARPPSAREARGRLPGDDLVPAPMGMVTKSVKIRALPESIWPWIAQIGSGRAGWYSHDWVDNGGHPSAETILSQHQHLVPGDIVPALPGATDAFRVAVVEPPRHLILTVPDGKGQIQVSYEFLIEQLDLGTSVLIVRGRLSPRWPSATGESRGRAGPPIFIERVYAILARLPRPIKLAIAGIGHNFMESRMLRGIKR